MSGAIEPTKRTIEGGACTAESYRFQYIRQAQLNKKVSEYKTMLIIIEQLQLQLN